MPRALLLLFFTIGIVSTAHAQSPAEIRALLRLPIDIPHAASFAATLATHEQACGKPPEFAGHAHIIARLEFNSLDPPEQESYKRMMIQQYQSNILIFDSFGEKNRKQFCRGLNSEVIRYSADFVEKHPHLFDEKQN